MQENIYSIDGEAVWFGDYLNAWYCPLVGLKQDNWDIEQLIQHLKENPVKTLAEQYAKNPHMQEVVALYPKKAERLNALVELANACSDTAIFKMILNELYRLIYPKEKDQPFPEEEYDPVSLQIPHSLILNN